MVSNWDEIPRMHLFLMISSLLLAWVSWTSISHAQQIPMHVLKELSQLSPEEVMDMFGISDEVAPVAQAIQISVGPHRDSLRSDIRSYEPIAMMAAEHIPMADNPGCVPQDTVVDLPNTDQSITVYPRGTKVKRCLGVCYHTNLLCRPTATNHFMRRAMLLRYQNGALRPAGYRNFTLEEHTKCSCECVEKPSECTAMQQYQENNCRCGCANQVEAMFCGSHRVWDFKQCRCVCPNSCRNCGYGLVFDEISCTCVAQGMPLYQQSRGRYYSGRRN